MIGVEKLDKWVEQLENASHQLLSAHAHACVLRGVIVDLEHVDRTFDGLSNPGQCLVETVDDKTKDVLNSVFDLIEEITDAKRAANKAAAAENRPTIIARAEAVCDGLVRLTEEIKATKKGGN